MLAPVSRSTINRNAIGVVVLLSIIPSLLIVAFAVHNYFAGRPLGWFSSQYKYFNGFFQDDEFWFAVGTQPDLDAWRIVRMDLKSGTETETGLTAVAQ